MKAGFAKLSAKLSSLLRGSSSMHSCLDVPKNASIGRITRFSGWYFDEEALLDSSIALIAKLDRKPVAVFAWRQPRPDVFRAYPQFPHATISGFLGDIVLPQDLLGARNVDVTLTARNADGRETDFYSKNYSFDLLPVGSTAVERVRSYQLDALLEAAPDMIIEGVPHYHPAPGLPLLRLSEPGPTHPYSHTALRLMDELPDEALVLDLGCGIKNAQSLRPNVVNLDAVHFRNVDVVSSSPRLPFRDNTFRLVISQAVFEHLPDPFRMAREIYRVLIPGGTVFIDTAFMQPLHGDPDHYFNMTFEGLRRVFQEFRYLDGGIQPYQYPSYGLRMQIEAISPFLREGKWRSLLDNLMRELTSDGGQLDEDLGPAGRQILAAGVFLIAAKP